MSLYVVHLFITFHMCFSIDSFKVSLCVVYPFFFWWFVSCDVVCILKILSEEDGIGGRKNMDRRCLEMMLMQHMQPCWFENPFFFTLRQSHQTYGLAGRYAGGFVRKCSNDLWRSRQFTTWHISSWFRCCVSAVYTFCTR